MHPVDSPLREEWFIVKPGEVGSVDLILDAARPSGKEGPPAWPAESEFARSLIARLPRSLEIRVLFLGNPSPYPAGGFARDGGSWHRENLGRGRFLGPVFESARSGGAREATTAIVLAAGRIVDAEDWAETHADRTIVVRFGPGPLAGGAFPELEPVLEEVLRRADDPIVRIEVEGPGAIPFFWDRKDAWSWDGSRLVGAGGEDLTATIGLLCAGDSSPAAVAVLASGKTRTLARPRCDPVLPGRWKVLNGGEAGAYRGFLREGKYRCPIPSCGRIHDQPDFRCPDSGGIILHPPVFSTLADSYGKDFLLFREEGDGVSVRIHPSPALRLDGRTVAFRSGCRADLYRYDAALGRWKNDGRMESFRVLEDGSRAVLL